jgi:beta-lactamase class C
MRFKGKYIAMISLILILISKSDLKQASESVLVTPVPQTNPVVKALANEYDQYFTERMKSSYIPGAALCIIKDDKIIHIKGYGFKDIDTKDSVGVHTVFRLGSVSKSLTATLTGILVEDSLIDWHNTVKSYLPGFKLRSEHSTHSLEVRHILSHTTGLVRHAYTNLIEDGRALEDMVPALSNVNLIGPPGTVYSYQNLAFSLIEPIVESVTEMSFEDVIREHMFKPMNMKDASASYESIQNNPDVAFPHYNHRGKLRKSKITRKYYNAAPAGGINASIWDMANFMIAATGQKPWIIEQSTLDELYTPQINTYIRYKYFGGWPKMKKSFYGLGFRILEYGNKKVVYHGGYVNGYKTGMAILPEDNIGICILSNYSGSLTNRGIRDFIDMYIDYERQIKSFEAQNSQDLITQTVFPERIQHRLPPQ